MDRFRELELFTAVADAGSFVAGGAKLNLSPPVVTRTVAALEDRLGATLFTRTTRKVALTESGERLLTRARAILAEVDAAELDAAGDTSAPRGTLSVTAPVTFGRLILLPELCAFLQSEPAVNVSVHLTDRVVDLVEEGIDLGVRIGDLPDSSLVARRIGEVRRVVVGSPTYLRRRGAPKSIAALKDHSIVGFSGLGRADVWRFVDGGKNVQVTLPPRLTINDAFGAIDAAKAGDGLTVALSYMVADEVRQGRLQLVLDGFTPPPVPVQLVYPRSRLMVSKVRAFIDFAAARLSATIAARTIASREKPSVKASRGSSGGGIRSGRKRKPV